MEKQEIAIIQNDKIIKILPREQYDQEVIATYQIQTVAKPVHVETTTAIQDEAFNSLNDAMQKKVVEPFHMLAIMMGSVFIILICGAIIYKHVTGKKLNRHVLDFFKVIMLIGVFFIFTQFVIK